MYVIITASDMETSLVPLSKPLCKALVPINGKPVLQYILDELYSYQSDIDEIIIVRKGSEDIVDYLKYSKQDSFFLTKIHCVERTTHGTSDSTFLDFYTGVEYLVDTLKVKPSEILVWSGDVLAQKTRRFTDFTLSSFCCSSERNPVKIYRFDEFPYVVNTLVSLKQDERSHTMQDFLELYQRTCQVEILDDFNYLSWNTRENYYTTQSNFLQKDEYTSVILDIDLKKEQVTKTNKYINSEYSYETAERSRDVQYKLWSEANFLDLANKEQKIFLPELIEQGINKRLEYCDWITEEFIQGTSLETLLLREEVSLETWKEILTRIFSIVKETFHQDDYEEDDEMYNTYVKKNIREGKYLEDFREKAEVVLSSLQETFSYENRFQNNYYFDTNSCAEWKMFLDDFLDEYKNHLGKETIIYNGTCERLVHNNLTFENILYDTFTNRIFFLNPNSRQWEIVDKSKDYATLYLSCYAGFSALKDGLYTEENGNISLSYKVEQKMQDCIYILNDMVENPAFMKLYSLYLLLERASLEKYPLERRIAMLKYARQLRNSFFRKKIL